MQPPARTSWHSDRHFWLARAGAQECSRDQFFTADLGPQNRDKVHSELTHASLGCLPRTGTNAYSKIPLLCV